MATAEATEKKWLTTSDVAALYEVNRPTVVDWIQRGIYCRGDQIKLKAIRVGGLHKIRPADLDAFIAALNGGVSPTVPPPRHETASHKRAMKDLERRLGE